MKKIIAFILFLSLTFTLVGCFDNSGSSSSSDPKEYTINSALSTIEDAGFKVENVIENYYEMIGASDGVNADIDEIAVELYIDSGNIEEYFFENPAEGKRAFNVSNLYVYIHSDDEQFYNNLKNALK